ncbi:hypothetical protein BAE44_0007822 [Dichanthelium oligosanthes]|uniref:NAC domain-containing protein n=1 Tax=Dichanthelium oligosanthes TaxID=888268 RepID=A0A1E5W1M7_9POAL|nr:hypothetical protein BAE44_0007822 [Dichanthelium oligosanthes]
MEGDGEKSFPMGFRFRPKDEELVKYYLLPRLQGRPTVPNDAVVEADAYAFHPDTLTTEHRSGAHGEWYFLSPRSRMYVNGVRPSRKTRDGRGRWKASTATKEVAQEMLSSGIKFCKGVLNYYEGNPKQEARTKWIMLEITVPEYEIKLDKPGAAAKNLLDEFVMCKIYVSPQHKKKGEDEDEEEEEEGTSSAYPSSQHMHIQGTAAPRLSEKQARKRPMAELPPRVRAAPARKQARQGSLSVGSAQPGCSTSNAASPMMQVYYAVPGQPLTGAHNGLQPSPMQRQAGAHNVQAPANPPAAGACGGRRLVRMPAPTPVMYTPFSQPTIDDPFGQMATTRLPNQANGNPPRRHPGGTAAFRPQVSLQCSYDQNYRAASPPGNASSSRLQSLGAYPPPQQMQQQPFFNGDANRRGGAAAAAPLGPPNYGFPPPNYGFPYQCNWLTPPEDSHGGAANERNGAACSNVNAEQYFVDLATMNTSSLPPCPQPQPAPPHLLEPPPPAAAGAAKAETETGEETSGVNTQDAA